MAQPNASVITRIAQRRGVRQFVKFGIVGSSGFLVNLLVFTAVQAALTPPDRVRYYQLLFSLGFMAGGVSNYFLNRVWTFRSRGHAVHEGAKFLTVSAIALIVGLVTSALVEPVLGHGHKTWFVSTVAGIVVNFFVNKYWTFRSVL